MQIKDPQFIGHEPNPFTPSQTIYVGGALFICFILYILIGENQFSLFLLLSGAIFAIALFLAFPSHQSKNFLPWKNHHQNLSSPQDPPINKD